MIARDLDGEDVVARAAIGDSLFRSLTDMWLNIYRDQYVLMGSPTVMSAKVIWDIAFYWGFVGFLYSNDRFVTVADDPGVVPYLEGLIELSNRMQSFFREWAAVETCAAPAEFVDLYSPLNFMVTLHTAMMGSQTDSPNSSTRTRGFFARWQGSWSTRACGEVGKLRRRRRDAAGAGVAGRLDSARAPSVYRHEETANPLSRDWIVDRARALKPLR